MDNSIKIKKKEYVISDELKTLANDVIKNRNMGIETVRIKFLLVYPCINKTTAGRCIKANDRLKIFGETDYVIEMSGELWDKLDDKTKEVLMWHELLHILPIMNDKTGETDFHIKDHDIKDFRVIIKEFGLDWFDNLKTMFSSVYDIEPAKLDNFSL